MFRKWFKKGIYLAFIPLTAAGCHRGHGRAGDAEEAKQRVKHAADWVYGAVDATEQQESAITPLLDEATEDLFELRAEREALAADLRAAMSRDRVDPEELSGIRLKALALVDKVSERGFQALIEIASQLEPEQRRKLVRRWAKHSESHGG